MTPIIKTSARAPFTKKAAALKKRQPPDHNNTRLHAARAPLPERLLSKVDVLAVTGVTFPTIWAWMRAGTFPRGRIVGGKSKWLSSEVDAWLANLPLRPLKGDPAGPEARA